MKILTQKLLKGIFPLSIIIGTSILGNLYDFNFMNYEFMPSRFTFIVISILMILGLTLIRNKINALSLDGQYLYQLHYLLITIWIFLFFYYKIFFISFITLLFNCIILFLLILYLAKIYKKYVFFCLYFFWFIYLMIINLLILL